ncbi:MAG: TIGR03936 family radical SAM-associated protein, partial [Candidatus Aminicenantaceae bacterium]
FSNDIDYRLYLGSLGESDVLPWDHIDTGIKKSHLIQELHRAQREESSPICLEKSCTECQGCSLAPMLVKDYEEQIEPLEKSFPIFGKKSESVFRYLAFYSKEDSSKYFSHTDLNNIIQRGFRRAGIPVCFTKGFHPKMIVSYPPALPLGMEGRAEVIEFRSDYHLPQDEFAIHLNAYLPPGIRFSRLVRLEWTDLSLIEKIQSIVYSLDLSADKVIDTLKDFQTDKNETDFDIVENVEELVDRYMKDIACVSMVHFAVDRNEQKLLLDLKFDPKKLIRPQDIVSEIFSITNPVYDMARERIVFKAL